MAFFTSNLKNYRLVPIKAFRSAAAHITSDGSKLLKW